MGGWIGGQACYVMVPYADFNLLKFPDKDEALSKIMDLTMLTDILPTALGPSACRKPPIGIVLSEGHWESGSNCRAIPEPERTKARRRRWHMSTGQCAVPRSPIATAISVVLVSSIPCRPTATAAR